MFHAPFTLLSRRNEQDETDMALPKKEKPVKNDRNAKTGKTATMKKTPAVAGKKGPVKSTSGKPRK